MRERISNNIFGKAKKLAQIVALGAIILTPKESPAQNKPQQEKKPKSKIAQIKEDIGGKTELVPDENALIAQIKSIRGVISNVGTVMKEYETGMPDYKNFEDYELAKTKEFLDNNIGLLDALIITEYNPLYEEYKDVQDRALSRVLKEQNDFLRVFMINRSVRMFLKDLKEEINNYEELKKNKAEKYQIKRALEKIKQTMFRTSANLEFLKDYFSKEQKFGLNPNGFGEENKNQFAKKEN